MAGALRCLARAAKFPTYQKVAESYVAPLTCTAAKFQIQLRNFNVRTSPDVNELDVSKLPDYETSNEEWNYVERLLPLKLIPIPKKFDGRSPAGWVPPRDEGRTHPYFVPRNKSHMMPVHLNITQRGSRHMTVINNIDGDICQLEKDIRAFLKTKLSEFEYARLSTRINEMTRKVKFRGDYVSYIKKWMEMKGF